VFTQRDTAVEEPGADDLYPVGTLCVIKRMQRTQGVINLVLQAGRRIEREVLTRESPFLECQSGYLPELGDSSSEVEALHRTMLDQAARMLELGPAQLQIDLKQLVADLDKPVEQAYVLSSVISISIEKQYELLAANTQREALRLVVDYLRHEIQVLEIQQQISSEDEQGTARDDAASAAARDPEPARRGLARAGGGRRPA
jgi:ATP-dependent Lon protease